MPYESSYELVAEYRLEKNPDVLDYNRCKLNIPYVLNGVSHRYIPDFVVEFTNKRVILEVKPKKFINTEKNISKFSAAREYCAQNGFIFEVWTEKELGLKKIPKD